MVIYSSISHAVSWVKRQVTRHVALKSDGKWGRGIVRCQVNKYVVFPRIRRDTYDYGEWRVECTRDANEFLKDLINLIPKFFTISRPTLVTTKSYESNAEVLGYNRIFHNWHLSVTALHRIAQKVATKKTKLSRTFFYCTATRFHYLARVSTDIKNLKLQSAYFYAQGLWWPLSVAVDH